MDEIWFEDELEPMAELLEEQVLSDEDNGLTIEQVRESASGVVRAGRPWWEPLGKAPLTSGRTGLLWKIRLHFEFEPKADNAYFNLVYCQASLRSVGSDEPQPVVYALYPQDLYEGEPQMVSLNFSPEFTIAGFGLALGSISTDINIGKIAPIVVGYFGDDDCLPHWELRPKKYPIEGARTFWLVLEQPEGCRGIVLRTRVEGVIQTKWGPIAIYPKARVWDNRPGIIIQ